jgi:hypothetical protein
MIRKIRALIEDARRYRWLRKQLVTTGEQKPVHRVSRLFASGTVLDNRIDQAMLTKKNS